MTYRSALSIALTSICVLLLFLQESSSSTNSYLHIYKTGTRFSLTVRWWGLSATGTMEVLENTKSSGKDAILVRSHVTKLGGFLGFIVKFLRMYKKSNTFDSYIDPETFMAMRYEVYQLNDDGSVELTEHIYFDRELNKVVSLVDNETIISDTSSDIQDAFSVFLNLLCRVNTEELSVGKEFELNLYAYRKAFKVEIDVTRLLLTGSRTIYTLEIEELPAMFKYPASLSFEVTDVEGLKLPIAGKCIIHVPVLPDITIDGEFTEIKCAS